MDYSSKEFEARYHYDGGDLGVRRTDRGTAFALWSPPAEAVTLRLYDRGDGGEAVAVHPLTRTGRGVWRYEDPADLTGRYYDFLVTAAGETRSTADPYARACGVNGSRSMVVDLAATDPEGWRSMSRSSPGRRPAASRTGCGVSIWPSPAAAPRWTARGRCPRVSAISGTWASPMCDAGLRLRLRGRGRAAGGEQLGL